MAEEHDDEYAPVEERVTAPDGTEYVVRAVKRGMPLRSLDPQTGTFGDVLASLIAEGVARGRARRVDGWVVGVMRQRGWRAAKTVFKEWTTEERAEPRVHELVARIEEHGWHDPG